MTLTAAMQGEHSRQSSFFGMIYRELIPPDHLLRRLSAAVDFSFVPKLVSAFLGGNCVFEQPSIGTYLALRDFSVAADGAPKLQLR